MHKILVIAPHADDEVLGCGGLMAKAVAAGDEVFVLIATNASVGAPELFTAEQIAAIRAEARAAHTLLRVKDTRFLELPAPALDQYPAYQIAGVLSQVIRELQPDTLYIPHRGDAHKDHRAIHEAALVAARPFPDACVKNIYAYETLSETEWAEPIGADVFVPTRFEALSEEAFAMKLQAMACYASQLKAFPSSRSLEAIEALGKWRGATVGRVRAEAFEVIRELN